MHTPWVSDSTAARISACIQEWKADPRYNHVKDSLIVNTSLLGNRYRPYIVRCGCSRALKNFPAEFFESVNLRAVQSYLILNFLVTLQQTLCMQYIMHSSMEFS